jgi:hypothetical protein
MKIYGKRKHLGFGYWEIEYKEFRPDGTLKQTGTEDFTAERWAKQVHSYSVHTWDGTRRMAGGQKWFDNLGIFWTDDAAAFRKYAKSVHADAADIQIRKIF